MKMREIVQEALRYPFSDWMKILILGIIVTISNIPDIFSKLVVSPNIILMAVLGITGFLIYFLVRGYLFKIIKSSLNGMDELPEFNNWVEMFIDGIKVFIVGAVYFIPAILFILISTSISYTSNPSTFTNVLYALAYILKINTGSNVLDIAGPGIFISFIYLLIIIPVLLIAIAYMADNNGELRSAFRFREIFNKIISIGGVNITKWYLLTGIVVIVAYSIIYTAFLILTEFIHFIIGNSYSSVVETIVLSLFFTSYVDFYLYRSVALLFQSSKKQSDKKISNKFIIIMVIVLAIVGWFGYGVYQDLNSPTSTGGTFENQLIKFNYPSNLTIKDKSTDNKVYIRIYNGTHHIGTIYQYNHENIGDLIGSGYTKITIAGRDVAIKNTTNPSEYIFLTSNIALNVEFNSNNTSTLNQIMSTLVVKKEFTPSTKQYSGNGIIFNYPSEWTINQQTMDSNNSNSYNVLNTSNPNSELIQVYRNGSIDSSKFSVQITPNNKVTDQIDSVYGTNTNKNMLLQSKNTITVDNTMAYEYQWITKNTDEFTSIMHINQIYLVKNNRTFLITIQATRDNYDSEEPIFDSMLKSLQIQ